MFPSCRNPGLRGGAVPAGMGSAAHHIPRQCQGRSIIFPVLRIRIMGDLLDADPVGKNSRIKTGSLNDEWAERVNVSNKKYNFLLFNLSRSVLTFKRYTVPIGYLFENFSYFLIYSDLDPADILSIFNFSLFSTIQYDCTKSSLLSGGILC